LEVEGRSALSADGERSFERLVHGFVVALDRRTEQLGPEVASAEEAPQRP
jgi:hypothetical protein